MHEAAFAAMRDKKSSLVILSALFFDKFDKQF